MSENFSLHKLPPAQRSPMSKETSSFFIRLSMQETGNGKVCVDIKKHFSMMTPDQLFPFNVFMAHAKGTPASFITPEALILVAILADGSPGKLVLWAYALSQHLGRTERITAEKPATIELLSTVFPWGFPTEEGYASCWAAQKSPTGSNLLDDRQYWTTVVKEST